MAVAQEVSLLAALRARTAAQHAALDDAFRGALTRDRYVAFLQASLAVLARLEPALATWLPAAVTPSRVERLRADLAALGAAPGADAGNVAVPATRAASLGAAYVVEGSTLGGLMLAERFERALGIGLEATTYLRLRGRDTARHWRGFLAELATAAASDAAEACAAAAATFDAYAAAMRAHGALA
ncbi:MAG TPA: biliverdin-producing heme oxygenase [Kofleriaceae bacterium]|nr:biliverdin-producing heme oxygenase [Kofleriaceae bacterium]